MSKNKKKILLLSAVIAVAVCLTLAITPTFARYFTKFPEKALWLTYESGNAVYVYGEHITDGDDEWDGLGNVEFSQESDSATLKFGIANGTSREQFSERAQSVSVWLVVGSTAESADKLDISLSYGETTLKGKPEEIKESSYLYSTSGSGWVYRFYGDDGNEMAFTLKGENFSFENFTLTVKGTVDATLLDLRVTSAYVKTDN